MSERPVNSLLIARRCKEAHAIAMLYAGSHRDHSLLRKFGVIETGRNSGGCSTATMFTITLRERACAASRPSLQVTLLPRRPLPPAGSTGLILTRRCGEAIIVDGDIVLRVIGINCDSILLALESASREPAPRAEVPSVKGASSWFDCPQRGLFGE
jgi:hypothetical protein